MPHALKPEVAVAPSSPEPYAPLGAGAAAPVRLQLLGRFAILSPGEGEIPVAGLRQRAMLAYLALRPPHAIDRERLAALLWSDADDRTARQNLRQTLLRLHRDLERSHVKFLQSDRADVRLLRPAVEIDAAQFEALAASAKPEEMSQAIALYGGHLMEGLALEEEAFDEWLATERARLKVIFRALIERYAIHPDAPGAQAVAAANRLVSFDAFDESAQRLLLTLLAAHYGGQAALTHADVFSRQLHKELGVPPEEETRNLISRIRTETNKPAASLTVGAPLRSLHRFDPSDAADPLFQNLPPRDMNFVGRGEALATLRGFLEDADQPLAARQVAIHGMGGVGKSSLAAEYAHRYADSYAGVWWAPANQRATLMNSLALLACKFDRRLAAEADHEKAATAGLAHLSRLERPLLLIYDDPPSPDIVAGLLPPVGGHVLITSRWPDWSGRAEELKLGAFDEEIAAEFLNKRAKRNDEGARRLAAALGCLPLALDHAGAYCRVTASSFDSYRERIDALLTHAPRGAAYPASIAATLGLAIDIAAAEAPASALLLGLGAFLSHDRIALDLLSKLDLGEEEIADALGSLYGVSLIEYEVNGPPAISIHPLVQAAMRVRLAEHGETAKFTRQAAAALAREFPASALTDPRVWPQCASLLRHVFAYRQFSGANPDISDDTALLYHNAGGYLHIRGSYQEAETLYRDAIYVGERVHGLDHQNVADAQNSLALLLSTTGRYDEAEPLFRQTIASGERVLGAHHLKVAMRKNNLARLMSDTKRYGEAEPFFREAIRLADMRQDSEYPYAVAWRNNLGILLNETGRNAEGERVYREALSMGARVLGRKHHEIARCLNNLGRLLSDSGRSEEAVDCVREALEIWDELLGDYHPLFARGQDNLAHILFGLGRFEEAVAAAEWALLVHENTLGAEHFWTRDSAKTCADAYGAAGRRDKARTLSRRYKFRALALSDK